MLLITQICSSHIFLYFPSCATFIVYLSWIYDLETCTRMDNQLVFASNYPCWFWAPRKTKTSITHIEDEFTNIDRSCVEFAMKKTINSRTSNCSFPWSFDTLYCQSCHRVAISWGRSISVATERCDWEFLQYPGGLTDDRGSQPEYLFP